MRRAVVLVVVVIVVMAGVVFFATWRSIVQGQRSLDIWSYAQLLDSAQNGQVTRVEISGQSAEATDRSGRRHYVVLSSDTSADSKILVGDGVDVVFTAQPSGGVFFLQILAPNLILLLLIGGIVYFLVVVARRVR